MRKVFILLFLTLLLAYGVWSTTAQDTCAEGEWRVNGECQPADTITLEPRWNTIEPEGETMCAHGTPFQFWVRPGGDDLLLYLQGGGGCSSASTCRQGSSTYYQLANMSSGDVGIFDTANEENPFQNYTMVRVPTCTGDSFMGTEHVQYSDEVSVYHHGFINASAALDFVGDAFPEPETVTVAGCSAGTAGSVVITPYVAEQYPGVPLMQFGDSLGAVFTFSTNLRGIWGADGSIAAWLDYPVERFTLPSYTIAIAEAYPHITFAQFNTQHDTAQQFYFNSRDAMVERMNSTLTSLDEQIEDFHYFTSGGN